MLIRKVDLDLQLIRITKYYFRVNWDGELGFEAATNKKTVMDVVCLVVLEKNDLNRK